MLLVTPVSAETTYSDMYISITDALINTKQGNEEAAQQAIQDFSAKWANVVTTEMDAKEKVDAALEEVQTATTKDERQSALSDLSKALSSLEKLENPVDEEAERKEFESKFTPVMQMFESALQTADLAQIQEAYTEFNVKWNNYEKPVREQSIGMYGQIETQMSFIRITLAAENPDITLINTQYETLKTSIEQFIAGQDIEVRNEGYSLQTLIDYINDAQDLIDHEDYIGASEVLKEFIIIWPNVELEISTRNGSLYNEIESQMPLLVSELMKDNPDVERILNQLSKFKTEIELLQENSSYSFWDSALILLREGLEALLIIMVLVSFLKKSNQENMAKWIYIGASVGIVLSTVAAIALSFVFNSLTVNSSREMLKGYVGIVAAMMMIGVGIWLHSKSTVNSWNAYLAKQMGHAISKQSVFTMASISFLSVFREGAETIIFYVGVAPKMPTFDFILGIVIAIVVLIIFGFVLLKLSLKIPIHKFFFVATVLIYLLAFKIIGTSIHTLQLTNVLPSTVLHKLPVISSIGFYPTMETIIAQVMLILVCVAVAWRQKQKKA